MVRYCGKPTKTAGHLCRWRVTQSRCERHGTGSADGLSEAAIKRREAGLPHEPDRPADEPAGHPGDAAEQHEPAEVPEAVVKRDIPGVCWLIVQRVLTDGSADGRGTAVAVSALRILVGLPASGLTAEEARAESFLRGKIMHGIAPQTPEEWELAAGIYRKEALEEFRRWELGERDDGYVDEPLALGELAGDEVEPSVLVSDED